MALTINDIYQWALRLMKKNQAGSLNNIDFAYHWNNAQSSYQDDLLGRFQRNNNGKEGVNTGLIETDTILNKLLPFTKNTTLMVSGGSATKPTDWLYTLAIRASNTKISKVFKVTHDSIWAVQEDVIDPPSLDENSFYYSEYGNYYSVLPSTIASLDLDYISTTQQVSWGFDFDGSGRQVYAPGSSIQSLWDDNSNREITGRMLKTLGVSFKDQDFAGFGESVIQTGE